MPSDGVDAIHDLELGTVFLGEATKTSARRTHVTRLMAYA